MSITAALESARPVSATGFRVTLARDWAAVRTAYADAVRAGASTPFQQVPVMDAWYRAMSERDDVEPLLATVEDAATGTLAALLPLIRQRRGGIRTVTFADLDLIDYNAPVLGPAAPRSPDEAKAFWSALRGGLRGNDLVAFRKMPPTVSGRPNPLVLLPSTLPCRLNGNLLQIGDDLESWQRGTLKRVVRKELERSWRVFTRSPGTAFRSIVDPAERRHVLAVIEEQQPIRMERAGRNYWLDAPAVAAFYRNLIDLDAAQSGVSLTALISGDDVIAALLGLRSGRTFTMIRISNSSDPAWTNCSPGRLIIGRTIHQLHAEGVRDFDFSVGNFGYKRRFGVEPQPLVDFVRPLTPLGVPAYLDARARGWLHRHPVAKQRIRKLLGRKAAQDVAS